MGDARDKLTALVADALDQSVYSGRVTHIVEAISTNHGTVLKALGGDECDTCEGTGHVDDPTACGDADHCSPWMRCRDCGGWGWVNWNG